MCVCALHCPVCITPSSCRQHRASRQQPSVPRQLKPPWSWTWRQRLELTGYVLHDLTVRFVMFRRMLDPVWHELAVLPWAPKRAQLMNDHVMRNVHSKVRQHRECIMCMSAFPGRILFSATMSKVLFLCVCVVVFFSVVEN